MLSPSAALTGRGLTPPPAGLQVDLTAGALDEDQAKSVLGTLGIATPPRRVCTTRRQARAALDELPRPVAVKLLDVEIAHKTDVGGVYLGVRDRAELEQALDALEAAGHHRFLVESMAPPGVDLLQQGASRDPVFGPVVAARAGRRGGRGACRRGGGRRSRVRGRGRRAARPAGGPRLAERLSRGAPSR